MRKRRNASRLLLAMFFLTFAMQFSILAAPSLTPHPPAKSPLFPQPALLIASIDRSPPLLAAVHPGVIAALQFMVSLTALVAFPGRSRPPATA